MQLMYVDRADDGFISVELTQLGQARVVFIYLFLCPRTIITLKGSSPLSLITFFIAGLQPKQMHSSP